MSDMPRQAENGIHSHNLLAGTDSPKLPSHRLLPLAALALFAGLGAASWISRVGEIKLTGYLRVEQSVVYAPRAGKVESLAVRTGEAVKPNQLLMRMIDDSLNREISTKGRELRSLEAALEQCRAKAEVELSLQMKCVDEELHRTRLQSAEYLREHYAASFQHVTWRNVNKDALTGRWLAVAPDGIGEPERIFSSVLPEPVVAQDEVKLLARMRQEEARNSAEVKKAQADLCDHHIHELEKLRQGLPEKIRKAAGVDVAEARVALATEQLNSLNQQKQELTVSAPGYGIVGSFEKQPSDPVACGEPLVSVFDREHPFVEVDVPSTEVNRLQISQKVTLEFAGEERVGRIETISPQARQRSEGDEAWIAVRLRPSGRLWPELPIGSAVTVRLK